MLFVWGCLVATAAVAGETHEMKIVIETDDGENGQFEWVSSDPEADFSNLAVGESKTIKGDDGKEVTVTRTDDGLEFDIDGKKIEMMDFADDEHMTFDFDFDDSKEVRIVKTEATDGVTIISSSELDDETRAKLEAVLQEAGKDGEVMFLDGSELHGDEQAGGVHGVHVIKKKIVEEKVEKD